MQDPAATYIEAKLGQEAVLPCFALGTPTPITRSVLLIFIVYSKGQLISKCLFGVFNFLQKTNENKSHSSKIEFVRSFFGGNFGLKKIFSILSDL